MEALSSSVDRMKTITILLLACCTPGVQAQSPSAQPFSNAAGSSAAATDANAVKARNLLNEMVQALGGDRWLNLRDRYLEGRIAAFYEGKPTGVTLLYWQWDTPTEERVDMTETKRDKHNWVDVFTGNQCWEVTYQGKKPMEKDPCDSAMRLRSHSIDTAVRVWMKEPHTLLMYDGQALAERKLADQVTLLSADNDAITIEMDADTHLPLSCSWSWRDPVYHDKNTDEVEFADYHTIDGLPTPFSITRVHNGEMTQQRFVLKAAYNVPLPPEGFDLDAIAAKVAHR